MKFVVYDNEKKAEIGKTCWTNSSFGTFQEALSYAQDWLGEYDTLPDDWDGKSYDYSGYGDTIEIRCEENANVEYWTSLNGNKRLQR